MENYFLESNGIYENSKYGEIATGYVENKKSKFISYLFYIENENMAKEYIEKIRVDNKEARHIVYIYSYFNNNNICIKFSDDGEPQGTGTKLIYETLTKEKITNVCIVIVRYFGGILLGAGPLARAYHNCAKYSIDKCNKNLLYLYSEYNLSISYSDYQNIVKILDEYVKLRLLKILNIEFLENVEIKLLVERERFDEIINKLNRS